jgi:prephenate dehydrogenase
MSVRFDTVTLIGVGLLGGSLGLALKKRGLARRVLGVGHRPETLQKALALGAIDEAFASASQAVPHSDLVVLCTPAAKVPGYLDAVRPLCAKSAVVTDVASTKRDICAHVRRAWAAPYRFVGSHPMSGSEKFGPEHSDADLFMDSVCFVEAMNGHAPDAHAAVCGLWAAVGGHVVAIDPEAHDVMAARTSHVPHVVATALARLTANGDDRLRGFVGGGFRDTTRIAEGRPELWRDICLTNADAIARVLDETQADLSSFSEALRAHDAVLLEKFFQEGRDARRRLLEP